MSGLVVLKMFRLFFKRPTNKKVTCCLLECVCCHDHLKPLQLRGHQAAVDLIITEQVVLSLLIRFDIHPCYSHLSRIRPLCLTQGVFSKLCMFAFPLIHSLNVVIVIVLLSDTNMRSTKRQRTGFLLTLSNGQR